MTEVRLFITKPEEREKEEAHVRGALKQCGYPDWAFKRVKEQKALTPEERKQRKGEKAAQRSLGQVSLPYVAGLSESYARLLKKYRIQSCMKPYDTLHQNLVHPKDKRDITENAGVLYNIPCKQCPRACVGETGRRLGVRLKEHRDDVEKADLLPIPDDNAKYLKTRTTNPLLLTTSPGPTM